MTRDVGRGGWGVAFDNGAALEARRNEAYEHSVCTEWRKEPCIHLRCNWKQGPQGPVGAVRLRQGWRSLEEEPPFAWEHAWPLYLPALALQVLRRKQRQAHRLAPRFTAPVRGRRPGGCL